MARSIGALERGYFSLRHVIPGYSFILAVLVVNFNPIVDFITVNETPELLGAVLGFATLLTGSALGLLVSQLYWWRFNARGGILGVKGFEDIEDVLIKGFGYKLPEKKNEIEKKRIAGAVLDCAVYLGGEDFLGYIWRRWDIYHLLSSAYYSLGIGVLIGLLYRCIFELSRLEVGLTSDLIIETLRNSILFENIEGTTFLFSLIGFFFLFFTIRKASKSLIENYRPSFEAIIRYCMGKKIEELKEIFPNNFKKTDA